MSIFIDLWQSRKIVEAQNRADVAGDKAAAAQDATHDLRRRIETLALANQALFEILAERMGIKEEEVTSRMLTIDLRDGKRDGKLSPKATPCRHCGRTINTSRLRCLYCDSPIKDGPLFGKV